MKWLLYVLIILLIAIIDQSLFSVFHLGLFTPDLLLLFVLSVVWSFNNYDFLIFAVLGGFLARNFIWFTSRDYGSKFNINWQPFLFID